MNGEIMVGLLSLAGTLIGSASGVVASARLTNYRIKKLEEKVDEHNGYGKKIPELAGYIKGVDDRLDNIERIVLK